MNNTTTKTPKAFISHASEDKDRFVTPFAAKLLQNGINAWLDRWEIKPGDSLVERIFEDGIGEADVFIVILSAVSVTKPWVREELDSGVVRKIEKKCRLIPVVIDEECEVPQALKHLLWVKIGDLSNYDAEFSRIVNVIHGKDDKPPLGPPPKHATKSVFEYLTGLTKTDNLVFAAICRTYMEQGETLFGVERFVPELNGLGLTDENIVESLEILDGRGYIEIQRANVGITSVKVRTFALDEYLKAELTNYDAIATGIVSKIVNENVHTNEALHEQTGHALPIINFFLDNFEGRGLIKVARSMRGPRDVIKFSPELKRMLG